MIRRILPFPVVSLTILALWLALAPGFGAGQVLLGALFGWGLPWLTRGFWPDPPRVADPLAALQLALVVLYDIITANLDVARRVLGPVRALQPGFVEVPLALQDPFLATVLGSIVSLTPGTIGVDVDTDRHVLLVHALHMPDPDATIAQIRSRYEAPLMKVFAC